MNVIWHKIWRDLLGNKTRTILVILSTAVGVFALGLVYNLSQILNQRMSEDYQASVPAHIEFWGGTFEQATINVISKDPAIEMIEGKTSLPIRWKLDEDDEWQRGSVVSRANFEAQQTNLIGLIEGNFPERHDFSVENQSSKYFNIPLDSVLIVEYGNSQRRLPITGVMRSPTIFPPQFGGDATFFSTPDTVNWLIGMEGFNLLEVRIHDYSQENAEIMAEKIKSRFDRMGLTYGGYTIYDPNQHWMQETVDTLTIILGVFGFLSLAVGAFLIINTINAIIAQQVWQIGVMKVIGATAFNLFSMFFVTTVLYGVFSVLMAVPLSIVSTYYVAAWLLDMINISYTTFEIIPFSIYVQVILGLLVPIIAGLIPVMKAAQITPYQAISTHGLGIGFGLNKLDSLIGKIRDLPTTLALGLRNALRRKTRAGLTALTLVLAGVLFITVMSVNASLNSTLDQLISNLGLDVWVVFNKPQREVYLLDVTQQVEGVEHAEVWDQQRASLSLQNGEKQEIYLMGLPPGSKIFSPQISAGRNLYDDDEYGILLNNKIAVDEGIQVGDEIELKIGAKKSSWVVVGLVLDVSEDQSNCYVPIYSLGRETGRVNRGSIVMVLSERKGIQNEKALITRLQTEFRQRGLLPSFITSASELKLQNRTQFNIIVYLMLSMALLSSVVGSVGLMGTMFINIVERRREIGVMRSIGAASTNILQIVITEGLYIGLLSWIIAIPLSYPASEAFSKVVGENLIQVPLKFEFSTDGVFLWLIIIIILSTLASIWPALQAIKISVREALSYE